MDCLSQVEGFTKAMKYRALFVSRDGVTREMTVPDRRPTIYIPRLAVVSFIECKLEDAVPTQPDEYRLTNGGPELLVYEQQ